MLQITYFPELTRDAERTNAGLTLREDLCLWAEWHGADFESYSVQLELLGDSASKVGVTAFPAVRVYEPDTGSGFIFEGWPSLNAILWDFLDSYAPGVAA